MKNILILVKVNILKINIWNSSNSMYSNIFFLNYKIKVVENKTERILGGFARDSTIFAINK